MSAAMDTLMKVDWSQVSQQVKDGLAAGKMTLSQAKGTVYWATGSGHGGIVAHLPLIPVGPDDVASAGQLLELGQAVKAGQAAAMTAAAVSTVAIAAVVVVATAYLANKIKEVQKSVDGLSHLMAFANRKEDLKQLHEYLAAIRSADELMASGAPAAEIRGLAGKRFDRLAELRLQVQGYVLGLLGITFVQEMDEASYVGALSFAIEMLDLIPVGLVVERDLCLVAGLPGLADSRGAAPVAEFRQVLSEFRARCDGEYRRLASGQGGFAERLREFRRPLNQLCASPIHSLLLSGLSRPVAWQAPDRRQDEEHRHVAQPSTLQGANA